MKTREEREGEKRDEMREKQTEKRRKGKRRQRGKEIQFVFSFDVWDLIHPGRKRGLLRDT